MQWGNSMSANAVEIQCLLYRLSYDWPSVTGYLGTVFGGDDQKITLEAAVAVRNEPFGNTPCGGGAGGGP